MTRGKPDLKIANDLLETITLCVRDLRSLPLASLDEFLGDRRNSSAAESLLRRAAARLSKA